MADFIRNLTRANSVTLTRLSEVLNKVTSPDNVKNLITITQSLLLESPPNTGKLDTLAFYMYGPMMRGVDGAYDRLNNIDNVNHAKWNTIERINQWVSCLPNASSELGLDQAKGALTFLSGLGPLTYEKTGIIPNFINGVFNWNQNSYTPSWTERNSNLFKFMGEWGLKAEAEGSSPEWIQKRISRFTADNHNRDEHEDDWAYFAASLPPDPKTLAEQSFSTSNWYDWWKAGRKRGRDVLFSNTDFLQNLKNSVLEKKSKTTV
jgi:hypothetical protein